MKNLLLIIGILAILLIAGCKANYQSQSNPNSQQQNNPYAGGGCGVAPAVPLADSESDLHSLTKEKLERSL